MNERKQNNENNDLNLKLKWQRPPAPTAEAGGVGRRQVAAACV